MAKSQQAGVGSERRASLSSEAAMPLRALSFSRSHAEEFKRDPSQGLSRIISAHRRALQRFDQGSITRKELKQLANDLRNYAHDIRQSGRRSAQRASGKIESLALGLDKRAITDLGPSSVRPISEILNAELETVLRKVASNHEVKKALSTHNAENAYRQLRCGSHYTTTPAGATVIFLASLESGRRALLQKAEKTKCEDVASIVAMTPREGLTLVTHYLPQPKGLQITLSGPLHVDGFDLEKNNFVRSLLSRHSAMRAYLDDFRDSVKTAAIKEGREDMARSNEIGDVALRSLHAMSKNRDELFNRLQFLGISAREVPVAVFERIDSADILQHVSREMIEDLAKGAGVDLNDPQSLDLITKELLFQPWNSIAAPDQVTLLNLEEHSSGCASAPDPEWSTGIVRAHVHPMIESVGAESLGLDPHNVFSKEEVTQALYSCGISKLILSVAQQTEAQIERMRNDIEKHAGEVQKARDLVQNGDLDGSLAILNRLLEAGPDKDMLGRSPLSLRSNGMVTYNQVSSELDLHEYILNHLQKRAEDAVGRLSRIRQAQAIEDIIEVIFEQPRGHGTFHASEADVRGRRQTDSDSARNAHGISIEIIENPFGTLYCVADRNCAITNERYMGTGERQPASIGLDLWLDGDRLTDSEIVRSYEKDTGSPAQLLRQLEIHDQYTDTRRFALPPNNILSWLITNRSGDLAEILEHPIKASRRIVAEQDHLFVDWPDSGTMQPEKIHKLTELLKEHAVHSDDINAIISQLDRFYRAAPDYETRYPHHATMPDTCLKDPALMACYLSVAERIADHGETLPQEISILLQSLRQIERDKPLRVAQGVDLINGMLDVVTAVGQTEIGEGSVRAILNSPRLFDTLRRSIHGELHSPELFPSGNINEHHIELSSPWPQRFAAFVRAETEGQSAQEAPRAALLACDDRLELSPPLDEYIGIQTEALENEGMVFRSMRDPRELTYPPECASDLRHDGKFDPDFARDILRKCLSNVLKNERVLDPDDWNFDFPVREEDQAEYQEATNILKNLLATEFKEFLVGAPPADPYREAKRRVEDEFDAHGYVNLRRVLESYGGSITNQDIDLHLVVAKEIAGRLVTPISPIEPTSLQNSDEAILLPPPSYLLIREDLFSRVYDEDFPRQIEQLVKSLYERDKVVRFWDLAVGSESDPEAAAKYNAVLLQSLDAIPNHERANRIFNQEILSSKERSVEIRDHEKGASEF